MGSSAARVELGILILRAVFARAREKRLWYHTEFVRRFDCLKQCCQAMRCVVV